MPFPQNEIVLELYLHSENLPISDTLVYRKLMREGVMVRTMKGFRFPNYIRVTVAQHEAMAAFIRGLEKFYNVNKRLRGEINSMMPFC